MDFEALEKTQALRGESALPLKNCIGGEEISLEPFRQANRAFKAALSEMIAAFEALPSQEVWRRRSVKQWMGGPEAVKIWEGLDREFYFLRTDPGEERRAQAQKRIGEGVEYLKKLVLHKIGGGAAR